METDYAALYEFAQTVSVNPPIDLEQVGRNIKAATEGIAARVCQHLETKIKIAATVGSRHLDLVRFLGNDLDDISGFPLLTLVKGPRDPNLRPLSGPTLLQILRTWLAPFRVHHIWHSRSNINRIVLSWAPEEEEGSSMQPFQQEEV